MQTTVNKQEDKPNFATCKTFRHSPSPTSTPPTHAHTSYDHQNGGCKRIYRCSYFGPDHGDRHGTRPGRPSPKADTRFRTGSLPHTPN